MSSSVKKTQIAVVLLRAHNAHGMQDGKAEGQVAVNSKKAQSEQKKQDGKAGKNHVDNNKSIRGELLLTSYGTNS